MSEPIENQLERLRLPEPTGAFYQFPATTRTGYRARSFLAPALAVALMLSLSLNIFQWAEFPTNEAPANNRTLAQQPLQPRGPEIRSGVSLPGGGSNSIELISGG